MRYNVWKKKFKIYLFLLFPPPTTFSPVRLKVQLSLFLFLFLITFVRDSNPIDFPKKRQNLWNSLFSRDQKIERTIGEKFRNVNSKLDPMMNDESVTFKRFIRLGLKKSSLFQQLSINDTVISLKCLQEIWWKTKRTYLWKIKFHKITSKENTSFLFNMFPTRAIRIWKSCKNS